MKRAIFFGQNAVYQFAPDYNGWAGILAGCVPDARDLAVMFGSLGFECEAKFSGWNVAGPQVPWVMTGDCTREAWRKAHAGLQAIARAGDTIILGNSGHGYQYDTTLGFAGGEGMCFYDGLFRDTEHHELMKAWPAGVNVIYILDTCYSGGMERQILPWSIRSMPQKPRGYFDRTEMKASDIQANIVQLCAAQPDETAADGPHNGAFTGSLLSVMSQAQTRGDRLTVQQLGAATADLMNRAGFAQHPKVNLLGGGDALLEQTII